MKKIFSCLFVLTLSITLLYSQDDSTTVIFFGKDRSKTKAPKLYKSVAIKAGITDLLSGLYGLHFESELNSKFALQAGGGATGRNFVQPLVLMMTEKTEHGSSNYVPDGIDLEDEYYNYDYRKATAGYFFSIQPKLYLGNDGFEGGYIGLSYQQRRYNFLAQNVDAAGTYIEGNDIKEFETQKILTFNWGSQVEGDKAIYDFSFGIGVRNITGERRDLWLVPSSFNNNTTVAYINKVDDTEFYFDFSIKIGLYWSR